MKKHLFMAFFLLAGYTLMAQNVEDDIQIVQGAWGKEKRELVRIGMGLNAADSVKFWPVYDLYEEERKKIGRDRILILNDYATNYATLTSAQADALINRLFKNDDASTKLMRQYYGKMKTTLNALQAAKFMHVESYLQSAIRAEIQGNLPVIGALDSLKTGN